MANNVRDLRRRIRSVKSTQQITRAMKLVAASKLRRAQESMERARPYAAAIRALLLNLTRRVGADAHPLLAPRPGGGARLLVVITADRGLAGSFNANLIRTATKYVQASDRPVTLQLVGRKARDFFKKRPIPVRNARVDIFRKLDFAVSKELAEDVVRGYLDEGFEEVLVLSNRFKTVMTQDTVLERLLPAGGAGAAAADTASDAAAGAEADYIYEPDPQALLEAIVPMAIETLVHQALLESYASEMGARMVAMENATKNAADMIERLTLLMNRTRQASITTEIIEIVSGAAALETHD